VEDKIAAQNPRRYNLIGIPVDHVKKDFFEHVLTKLLNDKSVHQIAIITLWEVLRAKFSRNYRRCLRKSSLVIPKTAGVARGIRFIYGREIDTYTSFDFLIKLLGIIEKRSGAIYLLGSDGRFLSVAESNIKETFPGARIVGRYTGWFPKKMADNIIMAIRKSAPDLLLAGPGVPGKDLWIYQHKNSFSPGLFLWNQESFDIFSGRRRRVSKSLNRRGLDFLPVFFKKPWRLIRIFPYMLYVIMLIFQKMRPRAR
jgi:N-acetylglucosaminyldiphosphoundecaprenol N-acetyl-beta-D-mannosaminyltransferase